MTDVLPLSALNHYAFIYFIGIGGIGMSALARFLSAQGYQIFGYDQSNSPLIMQLREEGCNIHCDLSLSSIPNIIIENKDKTLVVYTAAIPKNHPILHYFKTENVALKSRSELLGLVSRQINTVAVSGTHGKTTTSTLIAHITHQSQLPTMSLIGGIPHKYATNFIHNASLHHVKWLITEADEFNKSFLQLSPTHSVVTAIDIDHTDTYATLPLMEQSFIQFIRQSKQHILLHHSIAHRLSIQPCFNQLLHTYGLDSGDIRASNIAMTPTQTTFDYLATNHLTIGQLTLPLPGLYNVENALAAITICLTLGLSEAEIRSALNSFPGIKRRFSILAMHPAYTLIDDYAHHPIEIHALLTTIRTLYPNSCITAIFQPHLFSRTADLYQEFAESLSLADQVLLLPIYPSRETTRPGITSKLILDALHCMHKALISKEVLHRTLLHYIKRKKHQVIVTIGAGDIGECAKILETVLTQLH